MLSADLFLLPSVEEGIANVVLEAMALGVPVITTDCGGMREVLKDGSNGKIVSVRDTDAMVDAIMEFSQSQKQARDSMSENAKQTIQANHLISDQIEAFNHFTNNLNKLI